MDPQIPQILSFWFQHKEDPTKWFLKDEAFDSEIRTHFSPLVERARAHELTPTWTTTPKGTLALLILLDQFPRNIYRGSGLSFSSDPQALSIAARAIAKGFDRELDIIEAFFMYLPFMHAEDLVPQVGGLALYEKLIDRCEKGSKEEELTRKSHGSAIAHRDVILKYGRFPARNKALGRKSTPEEEQYLRENPDGFARAD